MFGGWSIDKSLFDEIRKLLPTGIILEFGSGDGTDELLKHYTVISIEHNKDFIKPREGKYYQFYAPLVHGWYSPGVMLMAIDLPFDLLLIDGPPGRSRSGMQKYPEFFCDLKCPVIFDDTNRSFDLDNMKAFCKTFGYDYTIHQGVNKSFAVCVKQSHD